MRRIDLGKPNKSRNEQYKNGCARGAPQGEIVAIREAHMFSELSSDWLFGLALTTVFVSVMILNAIAY
jgi:hypothetical protein